MATVRKRGEYWFEVKRTVLDESGEPVVKETSCCCAAPGSTRKGCSVVAGNKTPCRCFCHSQRLPRKRGE